MLLFFFIIFFLRKEFYSFYISRTKPILMLADAMDHQRYKEYIFNLIVNLNTLFLHHFVSIYKQHEIFIDFTFKHLRKTM